MNSNVCIDTIQLVTHLDFSTFKSMRSDMKFYSGKYYHYTAYDTNPYFFLNYLNRDSVKNLHYNTLLIMQRQTLNQLPDSLIQLLNTNDWKIQRIDSAFDFDTPITNHFLLKSRDNVVVRNFGTQNYYVYRERSKNRAIVYDKKRQLLTHKGVSVPMKHLTRFEIRIRPQLKVQQPIHLMEFDWLESYLSKFHFVPDLYKLPITTNDQGVLRTIMRRAGKDWSGIVSKKRKGLLQSIIRDHLVDTWSTFNELKLQLFDWLPRPFYTVPAG